MQSRYLFAVGWGNAALVLLMGCGDGSPSSVPGGTGPGGTGGTRAAAGAAPANGVMSAGGLGSVPTAPSGGTAPISEPRSIATLGGAGGGGRSALGGAGSAALGGAGSAALGSAGTAAFGGAGTAAFGSAGTAAFGGAYSGSPAASAGSGGSPASRGTFYVEGRDLYDPCGQQIVLRGVNEMTVWSGNKDGTPYFEEIAKTGANAVRIVWNTTGSVENLEAAITNAVSNGMLAIPELHDATGKLDGVPACVDYWTKPEVVALLKRHQGQVLVNIANEAGDAETQSAFESTYKTVITRMRSAGLHMPLVIDATQWGQNIDVLQAAGPTLITHDPDHNLLFSVHMWWSDASGDRVVSELKQSVDQKLPLIVGEFAQHAVYLCDQSPFAYKVLMSEAQRLGIGWLAWSWGGVPNNDCKDQGSFNMTKDGVFGNWSETWASDVAVTDPNSIKNTSIRSPWIVNGRCN